MAFKSSDLPSSRFPPPLSQKSDRASSNSWATHTNSQSQSEKQFRHSSKTKANQKASKEFCLGVDYVFTLEAHESKKPSLPKSSQKYHKISAWQSASKELQGRKKRDKSGNTQGTTIVHRQYRSSSYNSRSLSAGSVDKNLLSQSSSRKTTIFIGHPGYPPQRGQQHNPQSSHSADDIRRRAENEFYETIGNDKLIRRKSMIRTVSKEDYLLARGANPRTGLVTPGYHSFSGSFDEAEVLKARGIVPPGKWRQKGDQWITLDVGQQTPPPTSRPAKTNTRGHALRTPKKLASDSRVTTSSQVETQQTPPHPERMPQSGRRPEARTPSDIPGGYPHTPKEVRSDHKESVDMRIEPLIRRKPVREPDGFVSQNPPILPIVDMGSKTETKPWRQPIEEDLRSASAPVLQKFPYFSPNEVGKDLPPIPKIALPIMKEVKNVSNSNDPFLGQQQHVQTRIDHNLANSNIFGQRSLNKELPCLPMNNGLSPLLPCQPYIPTIDQLTHPENQTVHQSNIQQQVTGSRAKNPAFSFTRTPEQMYTLDQSERNMSPSGPKIMPVPNYDNPPKFHPAPLERSMVAAVDGPRQMPQRRPVDTQNVNNAINTTITTMNTTIPTFTNTSMSYQTQKPLQPLYNVPMPGRIPNKHTARIAMAPNLNHPLRTNLNMTANMNSGEMVSIPLPRIRPRGATRPLMSRMEGSQHIPRVKPSKHRPNIAGTAPQQIWSMTGMLAKSEEDEADDELMPRPLKVRAPIIHRKEDRAGSKPDLLAGQISGLQRKCSRCHNGFVGVQQRSIDGVIHTSESQIHVGFDKQNGAVNPSPQIIHDVTAKPMINTSPMSDTLIEPPPASLSDISEIDERDHTICCPECCKEQDCHEGCLGHPTPAPISTKNVKPREKAPKRSIEVPRDVSMENNDAQSTTSERGRYGRLAYVRAAFRNSFKLWGSIDKVEHGLNSVPLRTARTINRDSPPIELAAQPLSPTSFWGADGAGGTAGAIEAAKTAMGMKNHNSANTEDTESSRPKTAPSTGFNVSSPNTINANEGRRITSVSSIPILRIPSMPTTIRTNPQSRNVSGSSAATIEIQVPGFGSLSFGSIWEIFLVPFAVTRMWMRNHPQVMAIVCDAMERCLDMSRLMTLTGSKLWGIVFVYSKTGKLRLKNHQGTPGGFVMDCVRSGLYLLIFLGLAVSVLRMIKFVLGVLGMLGMIVRLIFWLAKKVLGFGILW